MEYFSIQARGIFYYARACAHARSSTLRIALISSALFILTSHPAFSDAMKNLKISAARNLAATKNPSAKSQLLGMLAAETDPLVRAAVVDSLSIVCPQDCLSTFQASLTDVDPLVRCESVQALGNMGGKAAMALLMQTLSNDENEGVRMSAAFWLGGLKDPSTAATLEQALSGDSDPHVRAAAANALKRLGTADAKAALNEARDDDDTRVQKIANEP